MNEQNNNSLYCRTCAPKYEPKYKDKDEYTLDYEPKKIICVDCGEEVYLNSYMDTETCRCVICRDTHLKKLKSDQNYRYYQSKKENSVGRKYK